MKPEDVRMTAIRAICRERCAFMGEPAYWQLDYDDGGPYQFPPDSCDEPGCAAIADAALAAVAPLIAAREREDCAALVEDAIYTSGGEQPFLRSRSASPSQRHIRDLHHDTLAAAIRARGTP